MSSNGTTGGRLWNVEVVVVPKPGVNDPEGESILGGLHSLGHSAVQRVQSGRFFTVNLESDSAGSAEQQVSKMADQLLANPVIQSFRIESVKEAEPSFAGAKNAT
jgi:phosphoribosylformylglycinamidine synthase PurS subunit